MVRLDLGSNTALCALIWSDGDSDDDAAMETNGRWVGVGSGWDNVGSVEVVL